MKELFIVSDSRLRKIINEELTKLIQEKKKELNTLSIDAPSNRKPLPNSKKVFLAGTIDSGDSEDWQHEICRYFEGKEDSKLSMTIYNPRREEWPDDGSKEVKKQIRWEHNKMDDADLIVMNILPDSKSPISLMEIGMYSKDDKLHVFCQPDFYRFDNVEMVCKKYGIPLHKTNKVEEICRIIEKETSK